MAYSPQDDTRFPWAFFAMVIIAGFASDYGYKHTGGVFHALLVLVNLASLILFLILVVPPVKRWLAHSMDPFRAPKQRR